MTHHKTSPWTASHSWATRHESVSPICRLQWLHWLNVYNCLENCLLSFINSPTIQIHLFEGIGVFATEKIPFVKPSQLCHGHFACGNGRKMPTRKICGTDISCRVNKGALRDQNLRNTVEQSEEGEVVSLDPEEQRNTQTRLCKRCAFGAHRIGRTEPLYPKTNWSVLTPEVYEWKAELGQEGWLKKNIYIILEQCWLSLNHFVGLCRTKCNIILRVLNIYDRAIIIIIIIISCR